MSSRWFKFDKDFRWSPKKSGSSQLVWKAGDVGPLTADQVAAVEAAKVATEIEAPGSKEAEEALRSGAVAAKPIKAPAAPAAGAAAPKPDAKP